MILVPFLPFRRAAENLETGDLQLNIVEIKDELLSNSLRWDKVSLASYGLSSLKVLGSRGLRGPALYTTFKDALVGVAPEPPLWLNDFLELHRKHLVLLGWLRHFEERGAKAYWCEKNNVECPLDIVKRNTKPLLDFKILSLRLTALGLPERARQYHKFLDEPEVVRLRP